MAFKSRYGRRGIWKFTFRFTLGLGLWLWPRDRGHYVWLRPLARLPGVQPARFVYPSRVSGLYHDKIARNLTFWFALGLGLWLWSWDRGHYVRLRPLARRAGDRKELVPSLGFWLPLKQRALQGFGFTSVKPGRIICRRRGSLDHDQIGSSGRKTYHAVHAWV